MYKKVAGIFLSLLLLGGCSSSMKLAYKASTAETRSYKMDVNLDQNMEMMGNEINITMQVVNFLTQRFNSVNENGTMDVSFVYDSLKFDATGPRIESVKDELEQQINKLRGIEIDFKIDDNGKILEFTQVDSLIPDQLRNLFNARQNFGTIFPRFPANKVKIGDSWDVEESMPVKSRFMEMNITLKTKYTLVGKQMVGGEEMLSIKIAGTMELDGEVQRMGMSMLMEGDGDISGDFLFDQKNGLYYSGTHNTEMDLTVSMTGQQNMTMPMSQFIKIKISKQ
ncbi:hypothetical protein B6I21_05980 [candidate division KSB1 bacterium 4572_119]|nr:MAG: hypothetical protein B6I21_05980 [candidate division KSB1 bacterium 4572_119]